VQIRNLVLVTSLFAFACGKSDDKRLDELGEACKELNDSYLYYAAECSYDAIDFECDEKMELTEDEGCIEEAEAALECSERIGYTDLECDEGEAALILCADEGQAWNDCVGL